MAILNWYDERLTMEDRKTERWTDLPGFDGKYRISSLGRIMSDFGQGYKNITPQKNGYGQVVVQLTSRNALRDDDLKVIMVARAVAELFVSNPHRFNYISFKNGDSTDCRACNLEWTRLTEKMKEQYASSCKKVNQYYLDGRYIRTFNSAGEASEGVRLSVSNIGFACRSHKPSGGYLWRYVEDVPQGEDIEEYVPPKRKAILQLDKKTGELIKKYNDADELTTMFVPEKGNLSMANIINTIKGKRPSAYGYKWAYEEVIEEDCKLKN